MPGFLIFVFHCEGGRTTLVISQFSVNLVWTGDVTSQPSVQKGRKCGVKGAETVDITIGDHFVNLSERLSDFPWAVLICFFENVRGEHWKTSRFESGFPLWRRPNRIFNFLVYRQLFSHRFCNQPVERATRPETWCGRLQGC